METNEKDTNSETTDFHVLKPLSSLRYTGRQNTSIKNQEENIEENEMKKEKMVKKMNVSGTDSDGSGYIDENEANDPEEQYQSPTLLPKGYDPKEFEKYSVPKEISDLFQYITKYSPRNIELDHRLKPFIPDFIPAVGDIDAFIKIPRPDGVKDNIGLTILDEPKTKQSDPAILHLQLLSARKESSQRQIVVKKVDNPHKNLKAIDQWIQDIQNIYKSKHSSSFNYTSVMPNIDTLMQEWPSAFEEKLNKLGLPGKDLECDLPVYVDIICALLDIPVYDSRIESLYCLFTLYSAIKNSTI